MAKGVWLGHARHSPEVLVGTPDGVVKAYAIRRLSEVDQWDGEFLKAIKGSPTNWKLDCGHEPQMVEIEDREAPGGEAMEAPRGHPRVGERRSMYLTRKDFRVHGHTPGCPGCLDIASGRPGPTSGLSPLYQSMPLQDERGHQGRRPCEMGEVSPKKG